MEGDDQLIVLGNGVADGIYTPESSASGNNDFQGTVTAGGTTISFSDISPSMCLSWKERYCLR